MRLIRCQQLSLITIRTYLTKVIIMAATLIFLKQQLHLDVILGVWHDLKLI
jgi:hypothetical protein